MTRGVDADDEDDDDNGGGPRRRRVRKRKRLPGEDLYAVEAGTDTSGPARARGAAPTNMDTRVNRHVRGLARRDTHPARGRPRGVRCRERELSLQSDSTSTSESFCARISNM